MTWLALLLAALVGVPDNLPGDPGSPPRRVALRDRFGDVVEGATFCFEDKAGETCRPILALYDGTAYEIAGGNEPLRVHADGYEDAALEGGGLEKVTLAGKGTLTVRLALENGKEEPANVEVSLSRPGGARTLESKKVRVERSARAVSFTRLPPGSYVLTITGSDVVEERTATLKLQAGASVDAGLVRIARGRVVEGLVIEAAGVPIAKVEVELRPVGGDLEGRFRALTKEDGLFAFRGVPWDKPYDWVARSPGWRRASGRVGGESRLVVTLGRAPRVTGRVVGPSGAPVGGAELMATYVLDAKAQSTEGESGPTTDDEGSFTYFRPRTERVRVKISKTGFRPAYRELPAIAEDFEAAEDLGSIELTPGRIVNGTVRRRKDGAPVEGVRLTAFTQAEFEAATANSDVEGRFSLTGLPEKETVSLLAIRPGYGRALRTIPVGAALVDLELAAGGGLEGRICGSPEEVAETEVTLSPLAQDGGSQEPIVPDPSGAFRFEDLEQGSWLLQRMWKIPMGPRSYTVIGTMVYQPVTIAEGRRAEVSMGCDGYPVAGVLLDNGVPQARAYGELAIEGRSTAVFRTDAQGRFASRVPLPGRYTVVVTFPSRRVSASSPECAVPPGGMQECVIDFAR